MKTAIRNYALADTNITALIVDRWCSFPAEQGETFPYVMNQRITETPDRHLTAPNERYRELWQFDIKAQSDAEAEALKIVVRDRFDKCTPFTMGDWTIWNMYLESSNDLSDLEMEGSEDGIYWRQMSFIIIRKKTKNT